MRKYFISDSLFERKPKKILSEEEIKEQFSYLDFETFAELLKELEEMGYRIQPVIEN